MEATTVEKAFEFTSLSSMVGAISDFTATLPARKRIEACHLVKSCCEAIETQAASEFVPSDGNTRAAERALGNRKASKRETRRSAKRAAAAAKNPNIAAKMKSRELSGEQVDAVVRADARTNGDATGDNDLLEALAKASADETGKIIDDYIIAKANADSAQKEHDRQRSLRDVRKHRTGLGLAALTLSGDDATIDAMHKQLLADAKRMYQADGGRDLPASKHPRTHGGRLFDAAHARTCGVDKDDKVDGAARAAGSPRHTPAARRPTVVLTVPAGKLLGTDPTAVAEQLGLGPIADSVLASYLASPLGVDLIGAVFGVNGQPLWLGRKARYASDAQFLALVVRDKGCVLCDAGFDKCQAHHRIPWGSAAKGETNIDDLVLLCSSCHTRVHEDELTLYRSHASPNWKSRKAFPHEIAPLRPPPRPSGERRSQPAPSGGRRPEQQQPANAQSADIRPAA